MGRATNKVERRRQICRGLLTVMAKKGFERASVAEIATSAGLSPGLVHYHFQNKLEILTALVDQLAARHADRLRQRLANAGPDPRRRLGAFIDVHLNLEAADAEALAVWTALAGEALRTDAVRRAFHRGLESARAPLVALIQNGIDCGHFSVPAPDPASAAAATAAEAAAAGLLAMVQGYFVLAATTDDLIPSGSAAHMCRRAAAGLLSVPLSDLEIERS